MKLRSIIIAAIVLISVFSVAASADGVLFGTPVVDGLLDSLYLESETITVTGKEHTFHTSAKGSKDGSFGDSATAYFLHDGEYLYACVKVNDNSVYTRGKEWVLKYIEQLSWENDAVEVRVYYTELGEAVQSNQYIFQADAYGFATENYLDMCGEEHTVATTINESGYICEFKIPLSFNTAAGEKIGLAIEIDDLHEQLDLNTAIGKNNFNAYGSQHPYKNMVTLSSEKAVKKIDITDDTKSNWARTSIEYVLDSGVMKAQGNAFNPYAVMSTKDVFDTMSSIYTAKTARVISDSLAKTAFPYTLDSTPITREALAKTFVKLDEAITAKTTALNDNDGLKDKDLFNSEFYPSACIAAKKGFIPAYFSKFYPNAYVTRAEMALFLKFFVPSLSLVHE